ncbi:hypothetical protein [Pedobacter sp. BAL39]|uniref:hypothetical protein n=1 Tax=Pedobacter sp. BAL39 TaxID=391596 RepID=UPI0012FCC256|nr:hypothetical protein [Pedobacter sp. BAL39]
MDKRTNGMALSGRDGAFSLNAFMGDSIIISKKGYRPDTVIVFNEQFINIGMVKRSIALEEVRIRGRRTSPLEKYQLNKVLYKSIYQKGDIKNMVNVTPVGIAVNVNKVFSALSKEGKDARRLQRKLESEYQLDEIDARFNKKQIIAITQLEGKDLDDFISEFRPDHKWVETATDYDIVLYIKEKHQDFLKNRANIRY